MQITSISLLVFVFLIAVLTGLTIRAIKRYNKTPEAKFEKKAIVLMAIVLGVFVLVHILIFGIAFFLYLVQESRRFAPL